MSKYSEKKRRQAEEAMAEEAAKRHAEAVARKTERRRERLNRPQREVPSSRGELPLPQLIAKCTTFAKALVAHGMEECGNTFLDLCRRSAGLMSFTDKNIRKAIKESINEY